MKLIIDIDERDWEFIKETDGCRWSIKILDGVINGTPLENELEMIKKEIDSEDVNCQYEEDYVYNSGLQKAIDVIDNHIERLKEENIRDCETCIHSDNGKIAPIEICHDCMWNSKWKLKRRN